MIKQKQITRRQHYVPRSYLGRFTNEKGYLYIRDIARDQKRYQRPKDVMVIGDYYRQAWAPLGVDQNILEDGLGSGIEAEICPVIDCLIKKPNELNEESVIKLLVYMELQRIRVPRQAAWGTMLMRDAIIRQLPPDIRLQIETGDFQLNMKDSARFDYMRNALGSIHPWMQRMEWEIFEAEAGSSFITTDSPVSFYNPEVRLPAEAGIGLAGTKVLFPLCSRKLLLMRHPECRSESPLMVLPETNIDFHRIPITFGGIWDARTVRSTNWKLARLAHELYVADNEDTLREGELI